jgi:DinB superfamily
MDISDLLVDAFGRIRDAVHGALDGASPAVLTYRPDADANSIAWLVWHLTRIQDDHVADVAGVEQRWLADGWCDRFGLPFPPEAHGYGHTSDEVGAVTAGAELLRGYFDAVHEVTVGYVGGLVDADLDRIVDERWDPPVSLGVRLVSVVADDLEHAGQAAYVRGVAERRGVV